MRPSTIHLPTAATLLTIWLYWIIVGAMIVRRRRKTRKLAGVLPEQGVETAMWIAWVPLVAAWLALPWLAITHDAGVLALPAFAMSPAFVAARAIAALVAIAALYGSIRAWRQMGSHWTMAVTRDESATLGARLPSKRDTAPPLSPLLGARSRRTAGVEHGDLLPAPSLEHAGKLRPRDGEVNSA